MRRLLAFVGICFTLYLGLRLFGIWGFLAAGGVIGAAGVVIEDWQGRS